MFRELIRPVLVTLIAGFMACSTEGCKLFDKVSDSDKAYSAEVAACAATSKSLRESCECRKQVDIKWGVCDQAAWQPIGRCAVDCKGVK